MTKQHYNPKTNELGSCKADKKECPLVKEFGEEAQHFQTIKEAKEWILEKEDKEHGGAFGDGSKIMKNAVKEPHICEGMNEITPNDMQDALKKGKMWNKTSPGSKTPKRERELAKSVLSTKNTARAIAKHGGGELEPTKDSFREVVNVRDKSGKVFRAVLVPTANGSTLLTMTSMSLNGEVGHGTHNISGTEFEKNEQANKLVHNFLEHKYYENEKTEKSYQEAVNSINSKSIVTSQTNKPEDLAVTNLNSKEAKMIDDYVDSRLGKYSKVKPTEEEKENYRKSCKKSLSSIKQVAHLYNSSYSSLNSGTEFRSYVPKSPYTIISRGTKEGHILVRVVNTLERNTGYKKTLEFALHGNTNRRSDLIGQDIKDKIDEWVKTNNK